MLQFNPGDQGTLAADAAAYRCPKSGRLIAVWARLDNREELGRALEIPPPLLAETGDPRLILAAYERWGAECPERLHGDFAFAVVDPTEQRLFAARDPLGCRPLYYQRSGGDLALSTSPSLFHRLESRLAPDEGWMARYLLSISTHREATPWNSVRKLPPGHLLTADRRGLQVRRYHTFREPAEGSPRDSGEWLEAYRERLETAVTDRLRGSAPVGCESSGGIDSSALLGLAARRLAGSGRELHAFGSVGDQWEPRYILETSLHHGLVYNHLVTEPAGERWEKTLGESLRLLGQPVENENATWADPFYRLAQRLGVRVLLSGFGGDQVVTSPARELPLELLDGGRPMELMRQLGGGPRRLPRFVLWLLRHRLSGGGNPSAPGFREQQAAFWPHLPLREGAIERHALHDAFLSPADLFPDVRTVNGVALALLEAAPLVTRLEQSALLAAAHGVEYGWPLLDRRLIEQWLATPAGEKWRGGCDRCLHRRALEGVVPDEVRLKKTKYMGPSYFRSKRTARIRNLPPIARRLASELHPALDPIVDRERLRAQADQIEKGIERGDVATHLVRPFRRTVRRLEVLDAWLAMYHP